MANLDKYFRDNIADKINISSKRQTNTKFIPPAELTESMNLLKGYGFKRYEALPNIDSVERKVLVFYPEYTDEITPPITCILIKTKGRDKLSHRDYLGAILSSGIERDCVGDIIVHDSHAYIFVLNTCLNYILQNITKIKSSGVTIEIADKIEHNESAVIDIRITVASYRLDCIISSIYNMGRNTALDIISKGFVSINGTPCSKACKNVIEGDYISVRGEGKCLISNFLGNNKKGRNVIIVKKYV